MKLAREGSHTALRDVDSRSLPSDDLRSADIVGGYVMGASFLLFGLLASPLLRYRIQACLRRLADGACSAEEASAAAGVAAALPAAMASKILKLSLAVVPSADWAPA